MDSLNESSLLERVVAARLVVGFADSGRRCAGPGAGDGRCGGWASALRSANGGFCYTGKGEAKSRWVFFSTSGRSGGEAEGA